MKWSEFKKRVDAEIPDDYIINWIDVSDLSLNQSVDEVLISKDDKNRRFSVSS